MRESALAAVVFRGRLGNHLVDVDSRESRWPVDKTLREAGKRAISRDQITVCLVRRGLNEIREALPLRYWIRTDSAVDAF